MDTNEKMQDEKQIETVKTENQPDEKQKDQEEKKNELDAKNDQRQQKVAPLEIATTLRLKNPNFDWKSLLSQKLKMQEGQMM